MRYEYGICIRIRDIVFNHGVLRCGKWPDLRLARNGIFGVLQPKEKIIADRGYNDPQYFHGHTDEKKILARLVQCLWFITKSDIGLDSITVPLIVKIQIDPSCASFARMIFRVQTCAARKRNKFYHCGHHTVWC